MTDPIAASRPAAFFDRDGVLNEDFGYVHEIAQFQPVHNAIDAVRRCNQAGYFVFIVTNQSGVARGYYDEAAVSEFHRHLVKTFHDGGAIIDDIRYCPHHPESRIPRYRQLCSWRKPGAGMIMDLLEKWPVDAARSFLIGDRPTDLAAAAAAGIAGHLFAGGDLSVYVSQVLDVHREAPANS